MVYDAWTCFYWVTQCQWQRKRGSPNSVRYIYCVHRDDGSHGHFGWLAESDSMNFTGFGSLPNMVNFPDSAE